MAVTAPTQFQDSFFQEKREEHLKGLDLWAKRLAGKWKRRNGILRPWWKLAVAAEAVREELVSLTDKEINALIAATRLEVTPETRPNPESLGLI